MELAPVLQKTKIYRRNNNGSGDADLSEECAEAMTSRRSALEGTDKGYESTHTNPSSHEDTSASLLARVQTSRNKYPPKASLWTLYLFFAINGAASTVLFATVSTYTKQLTSPETHDLFAGLTMGIPYIVGAVMTYPVQLFRDRFGYRYTFFAFSYVYT